MERQAVRYSDSDVYEWHKVYSDYRNTSRSISLKFSVKHETMLKHFRRLGLKLRPTGFRTNNCRGKDGQDVLRLRYLWFYNHSYKRRAMSKGLEFTLTEDEFLTLVTGPCAYCGREYTKDTRKVNGRVIPMLTVDRKDSNLGYVSSNCVSCCKRCNTIKMDMEAGEWIEHLRLILRTWDSKKSVKTHL